MKGRTPEPWTQEFVSPEGDLLEMKYMLVEPELATVMLNANTRNRRESPKTTEGYGRSMTRNKWVFVGDILRFADTGLLLDGQHRLLAIEATGVALWMFVLGGLPESVQRFIDIGRGRTSAGQLQMDKVGNAHNLSAAARLLIQWDGWLDPAIGKMVTPPKNEVTEYVHDHLDELKSAWDGALEVHSGCKYGISRVALTAAYARVAAKMPDPFPIANFYTKVAGGEHLHRGMPAYALRDTFLNSLEGDRDIDLAKIVRCWNAEMVGEPLTRYQSPTGGMVTVKIPDMLTPQTEDVSEERERELIRQGR